MPEQADITVSAHLNSSSYLTPFKTDTEDTSSEAYTTYGPFSLEEGATLSVSKSTFGTLNFLVNTTTTNASSVSISVGSLGSQGVSYSEGGENSITSITHQNCIFKYCQVDLSSLTTGITYYVYFTLVIAGSEYHYTLSFILT